MLIRFTALNKVLLTGAERLDEPGQNRMLLGLRFGDPNDEVLGAWLAKESVREVYLTDDPEVAELLLDKAIFSCQVDSVPETEVHGQDAATLANRDLESPQNRCEQRSD